MANDMTRRIKAVNLKRAKHLDLVEKETFVTFTMTVAIGFYFGKLKSGEQPLHAFVRAIKYESIEDICKDVAAMLESGFPPSRMLERSAEGKRKLFNRFRIDMRKLPTNYTDLYDVMVTIATHLPRAWQDWIDDAVERAVEAERRGRKFRQMVFRHIDELIAKEFAQSSRIYANCCNAAKEADWGLMAKMGRKAIC